MNVDCWWSAHDGVRVILFPVVLCIMTCWFCTICHIHFTPKVLSIAAIFRMSQPLNFTQSINAIDCLCMLVYTMYNRFNGYSQCAVSYTRLYVCNERSAITSIKYFKVKVNVLLWIRLLWTNFSKILLEIQTFYFMKMYLEMSSAKWRPFCLSLNILFR